MRSNCADSFSATHLQSGLRTQAALTRKSGTHCADLRAEPACAKQNGYCCARPLRRACAQSLCARPLRIFSFQYLFFHLWLGIVRGRFQCCTRGGVRCCTRRGVQCCTREGVQCCTRGGHYGGSDPPVCAFHSAPDPRGFAHHAGPVPPSLRGGRSRHSDPCRKARIAEG